MDLQRFTQLYERIQSDKSILLLGQQYLSIGRGNDPVWRKLCDEVYPELNLPRRKANYPELWENAVQKDADARAVMEKIVNAGRGMGGHEALNAVLALRWSLLYTSAVDGTEALDFSAKGGNIVPFAEKNAKNQYLSKEHRHWVYLCGDQDYLPPVMNDPRGRNKKQFKQQIANKISWISNTYLQYYGVLVIDGLNPECDWLDDESLFGRLLDMPPESIFWFGAPEDLGENASILVEDGIMTVDEDSFYDHMARHMPELLDAEEEEYYQEKDPALYTALTLRFGDKRTHSVYISRADIAAITGSTLCVLDDDILSGSALMERNRASRFSRFLGQDKLPEWHLFDEKVGEMPFYIPRDKDEELERKVYEALKDSSTFRKPIILSGPSNSGKSITLANLALTIARRRKQPVIFIRGDLLSGAEARLEEFISNWFNNSERYDGERVEKIVVIWDGSGLKRTDKDYESLQNNLAKNNVQVVGSTYISTMPGAVQLNQDLSGKEYAALEKVLKSLGGEYADRFKQVCDYRKKADVFKNSSLLYLLQAVFKFEFEGEYKGLSALLKQQFNAERQYVEVETSKSLEGYVQDVFNTQRTLLQHGIASSFQEKLKLVLAKMAVQKQEDEADRDTDEAKLQEQKLEKLKHLSRSIEAMNGIVAVASEFGVALPLELLLKFLRDSDDNSYVSYYGEETSKIINILRKDTLINFVNKTHPYFGDQAYVSFRNSTEAENYICLLCDLPLEDHSKKRKDKEVALLKDIIAAADREVDLWSVIELVRQFGPNGHGMLSELERVRNKKDYSEYREYWLEIADELIGHFPDDPEAVLLYSHLTREFIVGEPQEHQPYYTERYDAARTRMEGVLSKMEANSMRDRQQYTRLSVELCANYQQKMRYSGYDAVSHDQIKKKVREAFQKSKSQDAVELRRDFSSNSMLDILINAYFSYKKHVKELKPDDDEMVQIVCDIDAMLNLDELSYERTNLLEKVNEVYRDLGDAMERTAALQAKLTSMNSDAFLYLQARMMWQMDETCQKILQGASNDVPRSMDHYSLIVGHDVPYTREIPAELYNHARVVAGRVVDFLTENNDMIRKTGSERCVAMLLRAKWFVKTGKQMFAEKQHVAWTRSEWDEIYDLCRRYKSFHEQAVDESKFQEPFIPAYFLCGVYEWVYGDPVKAGENFKKACANTRGNNQMKIQDRLVLCVEGTEIPRTFQLSVRRQESGKWTSKILRETTKMPSENDAVLNRQGMVVSDAVLKYLFDGTMPKEQQQQARKEGSVRFNLIGARIGNPQLGGYDDER